MRQETTKGQLAASALLLACGAVGGQPAFAQDVSASSKAEPFTPICMSRVRDNKPQVKREQRGKRFSIVTVELLAAELERKGFERSECKQVGLASAQQRERFRDAMCKLTGSGNAAVQKQISVSMGERPASLCAGAQLVSGRYVKDGERQLLEPNQR